MALQTHDSPSPIPMMCRLLIDLADADEEATEDVKPVWVIFKSTMEDDSRSSSSNSSISISSSSSDISFDAGTDGRRRRCSSRTSQLSDIEQPSSGVLEGAKIQVQSSADRQQHE